MDTEQIPVQVTAAEAANSLVTHIIIGDPTNDMNALDDLQKGGTGLVLDPSIWVMECICYRAFIADVAMQIVLANETVRQNFSKACDAYWIQLADSNAAISELHRHMPDRIKCYRDAMPELDENSLKKPPQAVGEAFAEYCGKSDEEIVVFATLDFRLTFGAIREYLKSLEITS